MNFNSLPEVLDHFKNDQVCTKYFENIRWSGNPTCPHCKSYNPYKTNRGYKCSNSDCHKKFTAKTGTIFENSKLPMRLWFAAIWLATVHRKGISSVQLATNIGVTQKTAWFMLHRIREMLRVNNPGLLGGKDVVNIDESHFGGKEKNRHLKRKRSLKNPNLRVDGTPYKPKTIVIGMVEKNGNAILKRIPMARNVWVEPITEKYISPGAEVHSDESPLYHHLSENCRHFSVNHSAKQYVRGKVHSNLIENLWSVLKRGIYGVHHHVSDKHFDRYLDEFMARWNTRKMKPKERIEYFLKNSSKTLQYKVLTAKD